jgi:hemoglobin
VSKHDIISRQDVELLVDSFYEKVKKDLLLGPVFQHLDWSKHLPNMYHFWTFNLLGEAGYTGNIIQKHLPLKIEAAHFEQWLKLFNETVDSLFIGEKADEAKSRAYSMSVVIRVKMGVQ